MSDGMRSDVTKPHCKSEKLSGRFDSRGIFRRNRSPLMPGYRSTPTRILNEDRCL